MDCTACGKECPFVKTGFCQSDKECPNYIESWWVDGKTQEPKLLKDCAPKRMILQQQYLQIRLEGVQAALEQSRNEYNQLSGYFKSIIEISKNVLLEKNKSQEVTYEKTNLIDNMPESN